MKVYERKFATTRVNEYLTDSKSLIYASVYEHLRRLEIIWNVGTRFEFDWALKMPVNEELEVLQVVAQRLEQAGLPYMVTGSIAANFYAVPRMTRDIDIVIELSEYDVESFIRLFQEDFHLESETVRAAVQNKTMFNLIHNEYIIKVDFVVRKDSDYRRKEFSRKKKVSLENGRIYVVSSEDLILSKLEWAKDSRSEVQLTDVRNLLRSVKRLDRRYLSRWAKQLGVESLYREVAR